MSWHVRISIIRHFALGIGAFGGLYRRADFRRVAYMDRPRAERLRYAGVVAGLVADAVALHGHSIFSS